MSDTKSSIESTNEIYQGRVDALNAANEKDVEAAEQAEKDSSLESVEQDLPEEAKFVANPEHLRKEVDSEEKFAKDQSDGDDDLEATQVPAKATTTKKAAAKK